MKSTKKSGKTKREDSPLVKRLKHLNRSIKKHGLTIQAARRLEALEKEHELEVSNEFSNS